MTEKNKEDLDEGVEVYDTSNIPFEIVKALYIHIINSLTGSISITYLDDDDEYKEFYTDSVVSITASASGLDDPLSFLEELHEIEEEIFNEFNVASEITDDVIKEAQQVSKEIIKKEKSLL